MHQLNFDLMSKLTFIPEKLPLKIVAVAKHTKRKVILRGERMFPMHRS